MKGDIVLKIIINFLIPFVLLYSIFSIAYYEISGAFAMIQGLVLFLLAISMYYLKYGKIKASKMIPFRFIYVIFSMLFFVYFIFVLVTIFKY
jgi:hypothetical protein